MVAKAPRPSGRSSPGAARLALGTEHLLQERRDVSLDLDDRLGLLELGLRPLGTPAQLRDLAVTTVGRLATSRTVQLLQRAGLALLAPVRQVGRVQPLTAQQLANLARPGARVRLLEDRQLVARAEPPAPGPLDQLRIRRGPRRAARAAARFPSLAYGSLGEPGRGGTPLVSVVLRHPNMLRISPSRSVNL